MNRCPITYLECGDAEYSQKGLEGINPKLKRLLPLPMSAAEQRLEAFRMAGKLSIQGIQPKLSAVLSVKDSIFRPVERHGLFILKPQHADYPQLPENEGLTMHMARVGGFDVPVSGLVRSADGTLTYFIRRFDRAGRTGRVATEDFAQIAGLDRDSKYSYSMEKLAGLVQMHCTLPVPEKAKLFRRTLYFWLTGNDDMHLKNFSMIRRNGKVELAPLYDCLSTVALYISIGVSPDDTDEIALPLNGRKRNLRKRDLIDYYGRERLGLTGKVIENTLEGLSSVLPEWFHLIEISFLDEGLKLIYRDILVQRKDALGL